MEVIDRDPGSAERHDLVAANMNGWIEQSTHSTAVVGGWVFGLAEEAEKVDLVEKGKHWVSVW